MNTIELYIEKAVQAVLEKNNITAKSHQGALTMFSQHFVKTNIFRYKLLMKKKNI